MATLIENGYPIFTDRNGDPLEGGYIFIGEAGLNPLSNPQTAYWDSALTIPAVNIRTSQGYPVYNGSPGRLYVDGNYSIVVQDRDRNTVYTLLNATGYITVPSPALGFDYTQVVVKSSATITVKAGSTAEVNGISVEVLSDTDLQVTNADTDYYIRLTGTGVLSMETDPGTFDTSLNGRYDSSGRILNWIVRRDASASYVARMTDPYNLMASDQKLGHSRPLTVGAISGTTGTFSGAVSGTTGTFSGAVSGTTGTFSGAVSGATGTFSGDVSVGNDLTVGGDVAVTGTFSGTTGTFSGDVTIENDLYSNGGILPSLVSSGAQGVSATSSYVLPRGVYNIILDSGGVLTLQIYVLGSWRTFDNGSGFFGYCVFSDGTNVRVNNGSVLLNSFYYQKY